MTDFTFDISFDGFVDLVRAAMVLSQGGLAGDPAMEPGIGDVMFVDGPSGGSRHPNVVGGWDRGSLFTIIRTLEQAAVIMDDGIDHGERVVVHRGLPSAHEIIASTIIVRDALLKSGVSEQQVDGLLAPRSA